MMSPKKHELFFAPPQTTRLFALFNTVVMGLLIFMALTAYFQKGIILGLYMAPLFVVMCGVWIWIFFAWGHSLTIGSSSLTIRRHRKEIRILYKDIIKLQRRGSRVEINTKEKTYRLFYPSIKMLITVTKTLEAHIPKSRRTTD
ncbi:MAG: hypothetical protein J7L73_05800 [Anaerolineales bacterium]|nr:hypothetical protein [Anaerolineales bacterium]